MDERLIKELLCEANNAAKLAYAPYSQFLVGCVIVLKNGERVYGANIENASYPVSMCAERSAIAQVIMRGHKDDIALVVVTTPSERPGTPCGMCRQFLSEFVAPDTPVIYGNVKGDYEMTSMGALLPYAFKKSDLGSS